MSIDGLPILLTIGELVVPSCEVHLVVGFGFFFLKARNSRSILCNVVDAWHICIKISDVQFLIHGDILVLTGAL